ncbi:MAG: type II CAAX endopeptidase family protein [Chloroflexota bacterium]
MSNEISSLNPDTILPNPESPAVPWSIRDTAIGFGLFLLCAVGFGYVLSLLPENGWALSAYILLYQPLQFIPILVILRLRGATWADVGFQKGRPNVLALGCGLVLLALGVNVVNNLIMFALGVEVQAQEFGNALDQLDYPALFLVVGILFAPLLEETIFRGFLFGGLRHRLGWAKAALVSSAIFGAMHLSIAAFIPTFTLGFLFSYLYQRSNSLWPGVILHTLINSVSLCALFTIVQYAPDALRGLGV